MNIFSERHAWFASFFPNDKERYCCITNISFYPYFHICDITIDEDSRELERGLICLNSLYHN